MNTLPILIQNTQGLALVEVDGQAVITAKNLAEGLEYKGEKAIHVILTRNKQSFRDGGVCDMTRGHQIETPLSVCDTCTVRMLTPSAPDGRGGGLQDVRVFTKRGALKVCMKSNQPRAVRIQEMLIDLYEKVEAGLVIGAERFGRMLESLTEQFTEFKRDLALLKSRPPISINLPDDAALPISLERRRRGRTVLMGGLRFPEVRNLIITLRRSGLDFKGIEAAIKSAWPFDQEKWVTKSSAHRFWTNAKMGYFKEFGIDVTVH